MKNKYYLLIIIVLAFFTLGATNDRYKNPSTKEMEEKEYQISTCVYQINSSIWIFETKINKKTGKVVSRKQVHSKKYKNIK
tara:strand:- start:14 stop:256 length:243 start_codon:yes stop_codon:yes gene_type:complete